MNTLVINVDGTPVQQGSKKGFYNPRIGRVQMTDDNKARLQPWRATVTAAARNTIADIPGYERITGPVEVRICFYFLRPKSHYGTGKNANVLKPTAPTFVAVKPDLDKLERSILDALTDAGVWQDDSRVVRMATEKRYSTRAGAQIAVTPITPPTPPATSPTDGSTNQQQLQLIP